MPPTNASILSVQFANRAYPDLGLEPLRLSDLLKRLPPEHFTVPQSPSFHLLLLATAGHGDHFVDFARVRCQTGTLIHVRPGQVQQFVLDQSLEASVLLFTPEFVLPTTSTFGLHVGSLIDGVAPEGYGQFGRRVFEGFSWSFATIEREYKATDGSPLSVRILQHLLYALLLSIARESLRSSASLRDGSYALTFRRFSKAVEGQFTRTRAVQDYAQAIGCSVKSLRRACEAVRDQSPKAVIEQRVILEAKRLLAHTDLPVEAIAGAVGFSEPTNFVKFFRKHGGMRPLDFRYAFPGSNARIRGIRS